MRLPRQFELWFGQVGSAERIPRSTDERESPRRNGTFLVLCESNGALIQRRGNLGIGGFCFESERRIPSGNSISLTFQLPGRQDWISVRGVVLGHVRYTGWWGIRGCFSDIEFEDERLLARWLDSSAGGVRVCDA